MNLYEIHDDVPAGSLFWEETCYMAIWADDEKLAFQWYRKMYQKEVGHWIDVSEVKIAKREIEVEPAKEGTHEEVRGEVLRKLGWRVEGEQSCDGCGLHAMGLKEMKMCEECGHCSECGCTQGCENADGRMADKS